ncbi:MAG: glycoside hydrolase family 3 protein [Muribaculaceae bacterium]|nr:glycoside hydrolase family 3 protein [Muribaculaceae bacterium]
MKRIMLTLAIALLAASSLFAQLPPDSVIRRYAAGMLMVGFKGDSVTEDCDAARYVRDLKVGAIVLFDIDMTGDATLGSRNITSKERLTRMTAQLLAWADYPLLIATDQEGGKVARLKPRYGFLPTVTAEYLGTVDNEDTTRYYAARLSREMREAGVNVNLAPVVDVLNHDCAAVGHFLRSFSTDPQVIVRHAGWFIDESHKQGIMCTLKHFPGHGNAIDDSHYGFVDVTNAWTPQELEPFKMLIATGQVDMVMTAHLFNRQIDEEYPATLSAKTIDGLLRGELGFDGVVVTDDLYMQAIRNQYSIPTALELAINAGADLICVGNNISTGFEADRPFKLVDMIVNSVKQGRISWQRMEQSHERLMKLGTRN